MDSYPILIFQKKNCFVPNLDIVRLRGGKAASKHAGMGRVINSTRPYFLAAATLYFGLLGALV